MKNSVARMQWASFMNTGTAGAPVWSLMGEGFTELELSMNAVEYARHYVHEQTERVDVTGFAPKIAYSCDVYTGDPVIEKLLSIADGEKVGSEAQVEIVDVKLYQPVEAGGFEASRRVWSVIPDTKGEGVDALVMTGVFAAVGDKVDGVFDPEAGTFVEAS